MNELNTTQFKYKQVDMNDFWNITNNLAPCSRQMLLKNTTLHFCRIKVAFCMCCKCWAWVVKAVLGI